MNKVLGMFFTALLASSIFYSGLAISQPRYNAPGAFFDEVCSACHGSNLEGTNLGTPLVGNDLTNGDSVEAVKQSISAGNLEAGMPPFAAVYDEGQIQSLALYVLEQRAGFNYDSYQMREQITIPQAVQQSQVHDFAITVVNDDIDPLPYSIEPLADGQVLLVEKQRGLSIISADGEQSELIAGTPRVWDDPLPEGLRALARGKGWLQDVVLHPDYESNGWIYIYYGDRCDDCNAISRAEGVSVGMAKILRGRISDGEWVDQQTIWSTGYENYTTETHLKLGGRIAIDNQGYLYFSLGAMNGFYDADIQNLSKPWGKMHRVHDDGRIPIDNPFVEVAGAVQSTWTVGHRAPQGLEYDIETETLWGSEHGPRGGDEINLLIPGGNYGWPLTTLGVDYDGSPVEGKVDIEFNIEDIQQPVVDLTPSPAISSFVIYQGDQFPNWEGNIIAGSLKAKTLYRFVIEDNKLVEKETLVENIGRIRDIEVDAEGHILLLSEHAEGSKILRMSPAR